MIILSRHTLYVVMGVNEMNWFKKKLKNFTKNNNRCLFENEIQRACQYNIIEFDV